MKLVFIAALLFIASACAQEPRAPQASPPPDAGQQTQPQPQQPAVPEAPPEVEPEETVSADAPRPLDYGGPAILSRGGSARISQGGDFVNLRPFVTLNGIYDSGLAITTLDSEGKVPFHSAFGVESIFGVTGAHAWRTAALELDYRGSLRHYTENSYYDGFDNSLELAYKKRLSPRTSVVLGQNAAYYSRAFSLPISGFYNAGFNAYDPNFAGLTTNDLFDTPTLALLTSGRIVHQMTPRLSFSAGGNGFFVRRRSKELFGSNGATATGDVAYRLTRYQTISVGYSFTHFDFEKLYGQSDMHGVMAGYSVRIGRNWELALLAGAFRVESIRNTRVELDPVIAAILGQKFGIEKFYDVVYIPRYGAHLTRRFRRASATFGYDRTVLAGNGIYATSSYEIANFGLSYQGSRRLSIQAGANYTRYSSLTLSIGRYRSYSGGVGFGYLLAKGLSLLGRIDQRHYEVQSSELNRAYYRATLGFGWSPSEYPLALW